MILQEIKELRVLLDNPLVSNSFELRIPNLKIMSNERIGVIGKSGAGKTTFSRLLAGLLKPTSGSIKNYPENLAIGLSFQFPENQFYMNSILDDIMVGVVETEYSNTDTHKSALEALELVNLSPNIYGHRNHMALSGGEKRRAALATIIALKPDLYIFDEPTAALDGIEIRNLTKIMNNISEQGKTIIIVSQDSAFIAENCDRLIVFDKGLVVYDGRSIDFFLNDDLADKHGIELPPVVKFLNDILSNGLRISPKNLNTSDIFSLIKLELESVKSKSLIE